MYANGCSIVPADIPREALDRPDVQAAAIYGSWVTGARRPDSDIDGLVVGDADLGWLRKLVRPIGKSAGRNVDLTALGGDEFRRLLAERSSFIRRVTEAPMTLLVGDLESLASQCHERAADDELAGSAARGAV
jgi:predicted nucleotidyltransferase